MIQSTYHYCFTCVLAWVSMVFQVFKIVYRNISQKHIYLWPRIFTAMLCRIDFQQLSSNSRECLCSILYDLQLDGSYYVLMVLHLKFVWSVFFILLEHNTLFLMFYHLFIHLFLVYFVHSLSCFVHFPLFCKPDIRNENNDVHVCSKYMTE